MSEPYDPVEFGRDTARQNTLFFHKSKVAALDDALKHPGLTESNKAYLTAERDYHAAHADGLRRAMQKEREDGTQGL